MKLEDQCVSLHFAKRLKELGFKKESYWYWSLCIDNTWELKHLTRYWDNDIAAFTVSELGEFLFPNVKINTIKVGDVFYLHQFGIDKEFTADTEANARAKILIYLIDNKLIEV